MACFVCNGKQTLPLVNLWEMFRSEKMLTDYKPADIPTLEAPCCYCRTDDLRSFIEKTAKTNDAPNIFSGVRVYRHPEVGSVMLAIVGAEDDDPLVMVLYGEGR
jgi:hypothetical protein